MYNKIRYLNFRTVQASTAYFVVMQLCFVDFVENLIYKLEGFA